jgi:hypothetical protein
LEGDARVVTEGGDEVLAVDGGELDMFETGGGDFLAGGFEANAQWAIIVGVNADVNHAAVLCAGWGKVKQGAEIRKPKSEIRRKGETRNPSPECRD